MQWFLIAIGNINDKVVVFNWKNMKLILDWSLHKTLSLEANVISISMIHLLRPVMNDDIVFLWCKWECELYRNVNGNVNNVK